MTRMIACTCIGFFALSLLHANDVDKYPPGQKPFHSPKAPQPNGVFANDACYGFHTTKWTPWNAACGNCTGSGHALNPQCQAVGSSCTSNAIIIFDDAPATTTAPSRGTIMPAPESSSASKPMPPVKK